AVDVEMSTQVPHAHGRAFNMPAGTAWSPRALPRGLAGLGALPECEIARISLQGGGLDPGAGHQLFGIAVAELAVIRGTGHVEVDVAPGRVGKPLVDQPRGDLDDLGDVLGGAGHLIDPALAPSDAQRLEAVEIIPGHLLGQLLDRRPVLLGLNDQLVVHVGDVDYPGDTVAEIDEVALDRIKDHRSNHVADVAFRVDRRPANVHADLAGGDRLEGLLGLTE